MGTPPRQQPPEDISGPGWIPASEEDRRAVREQLERVLAGGNFSASKRYPRLLQHLVDETLAGRGEQLKERTLGVEVFGRDAAYDTNRDPVVRTSAAQVRQRVAQYYQEPGHESELRIEFVPGSYVPLFRRPDSAALPAPLVEPRRRFEPWWIALAAAVLLACFGAMHWARKSSPAERFWGPVWDKSAPVVICVPGRFPTSDAEPLSIHESLKRNSIAWPDATALYALVAFLEKREQPYQVRRAGDTALSDLRNGPVILVGGLNNPWLMRLTERCRFSYRNDLDTGRAWIHDAQNPDKQECRVDWRSPYAAFEEDYGIVSRVWDPTTERIVVTASGIASYGTIAAGDFLTNPKYLALIAEKAPAGWERKNLQVVFATKVFNGNAGPPRIVAIHVF